MICDCNSECFSYTNISKDTKIYCCKKTQTSCDISRGKYSTEASKKQPCAFFKEVDKNNNIIQSVFKENTSKCKNEYYKDIILVEKRQERKYFNAPSIMGIHLDSEEENIFLNLLYTEGYSVPKNIKETSKNNILVLYMLCRHKKYTNMEYNKIVKVKNEENEITEIIHDEIYESSDDSEISDTEESEEDFDEENEEYHIDIEDDPEDSEDDSEEEDTIYDI